MSTDNYSTFEQVPVSKEQLVFELITFCMQGPFGIQPDRQIPPGALGIRENPRTLLYPPGTEGTVRELQSAFESARMTGILADKEELADMAAKDPPPETEADPFERMTAEWARAMMEGRAISLSETEGVATCVLADGRRLHVLTYTTTWARLGITPTNDDGRFDDFWEYKSRQGAVDAMNEWDPLKSPEPKGWFKHERTGRRGERNTYAGY